MASTDTIIWRSGRRDSAAYPRTAEQWSSLGIKDPLIKKLAEHPCEDRLEGWWYFRLNFSEAMQWDDSVITSYLIPHPNWDVVYNLVWVVCSTGGTVCVKNPWTCLSATAIIHRYTAQVMWPIEILQYYFHNVILIIMYNCQSNRYVAASSIKAPILEYWQPIRLKTTFLKVALTQSS